MFQVTTEDYDYSVLECTDCGAPILTDRYGLQECSAMTKGELVKALMDHSCIGTVKQEIDQMIGVCRNTSPHTEMDCEMRHVR